MNRSSPNLSVCLVFLAILAALALFPAALSAAVREFYYVNTPNTTLYSLPLYTSTITGTVQLNDRVEKLGDSPKGWTKVRNPRDGATGWLPARYLSIKAVSPRPAVAAPRKRPKRVPAAKPKPDTEEPASADERPKPM